MKRVLFIVLIAGLCLAGCNPTPENTEIVVSDAITSNGDLSEPEIGPNATVYQIERKDKSSLVKYLLGKKLAGVQVRFSARAFGATEWTALGSAPVLTDANGRAALPALRQWLPDAIRQAAPVDVQLRAEVVFADGRTVSDELGLIRVLGSPSASPQAPANPAVLCTDHDNTLHATGGLNTLADWINFINWARQDWPLVDQYVVPGIQELRAAGKDVAIVSGMPTEIRALCRQQVNRHFENGARRGILLIIKSDLAFEHGYAFKAGALAILKQLYGPDKILAMVGDTVREDGYGAHANRLFYIPYKVYYRVQPSLLDTEGYGFITPDAIAWDWSQVMQKLEAGDQVSNFFLQNANGFLNIAHRGDSAHLPENTLPAYRNAMTVGADGFECDVHSSQDGYLVISHDGTVDRCTDGSGEITALTLAQLKQLDAGYRFTTDGGTTYPFRGKNVRIPTLAELFGDPELDKAPMVVEIKQVTPSVADGVLDLLQAYDMVDRVIVESFDTPPMQEIRADAELRGIKLLTSFTQSEIITFFLTPLPVMLANGYTPPAPVLQVPRDFTLGGIAVRVVNDEFMNKARYLGLKVQVWTINDPDQMRSLKDQKKVDGIMTDDPALLKDVVNG